MAAMTTSCTHPSMRASSVSRRDSACFCSSVWAGSKTPEDMTSWIACGSLGSMPCNASWILLVSTEMPEA